MFSDRYADVINELNKTKSSKQRTDTKIGHDYGLIYNLVFNSVYNQFDRKLNILEVGVSHFGEGSLTAFSRLNIVNKYVGIDVEDYTGNMNDKSIFYKMDAYNTETIEFIFKEHGEFDIVIDDGTHHELHQDFFLLNYHKLVIDAGFLICEDIYSNKLFDMYAGVQGFIGIDLNKNQKYSGDDEHQKFVLVANRIIMKQIFKQTSIKEYSTKKQLINFV